jgi:hypothetical protein
MIKPMCAHLQRVCIRDVSLSMELMRDGDWVLAVDTIMFKTVSMSDLSASRFSKKQETLCDSYDRILILIIKLSRYGLEIVELYEKILRKMS